MFGSVPVKLAVRDCNTSVATDALTSVNFTDDCEALAVSCLDGYPFEYCDYPNERGAGTPGRFVVDSDDVFEFWKHKHHVGNVCWDRVVMTAEEAARFAEFLSRMNGWSKEVWCDGLGKCWDRKRFTAADFLEFTIV